MKLEKDIAIFENVLDHAQCQSYIQHYEELSSMNLTLTRNESRDAPMHIKADTQAFLFESNVLHLSVKKGLFQDFLQNFWSCFTRYTTFYSLLEEAETHSIRSMKIQKTLPGQGYHKWHFESDTRDHSGRIVAWSVYLNTVEQGGETEWLYQGIRVPAIEGTLAIWPAGFTHVHRGNPPLSGEKYLMTGWVEY
jgi:hypothetical protein